MRRRRASSSAASAAVDPRRPAGGVADYVALVRHFNPDGVLEQYPGSPAFAQMLLRPQDQLRVFELHPTEQQILRTSLGDAGRDRYDGDGFDGLKGQLPPSSRRAAVLIDPELRGQRDYGKVVRRCAKRWRASPRASTGLVSAGQQARGGELPKRLEALAPKGWLHARLTVQQPDAQGFGLAGSGMFVINPPHALAASCRACCRTWSTCSASTTARITCSSSARPEPAA